MVGDMAVEYLIIYRNDKSTTTFDNKNFIVEETANWYGLIQACYLEWQ